MERQQQVAYQLDLFMEQNRNAIDRVPMSQGVTESSGELALQITEAGEQERALTVSPKSSPIRIFSLSQAVPERLVLSEAEVSRRAEIIEPQKGTIEIHNSTAVFQTTADGTGGCLFTKVILKIRFPWVS